MALNDLTFLYVSYWSEPSTWGQDFQPLEGESVAIPKGLNLLVDIDATPLLNAIIVEGSIIFLPDADPNHHREFHANIVIVQGGLWEAGTEDHPYTSKLTITMYGDEYSPSLPTFGNKIIGVHKGTLHMFGNQRTPTWTSLSQTADVGADTIHLMEEVDWVAGEHIAIASTSFNSR